MTIKPYTPDELAQHNAEKAEEIRAYLLEYRHNKVVSWVPMLKAAESVCLKHFKFDSLVDFIEAPFDENGLNMSIETARHLLLSNPGYKRQAKPLLEKLKRKEVGEKAKSIPAIGKNGRPKNSANPTNGRVLKQGSNSTAYRTAKLKRDHPEIAAKLEAGEFKKVIDAERAAGIEPPKPEPLGKFTLNEGDYEGFVADLKERLTPEQFTAVFYALKMELECSQQKNSEHLTTNEKIRKLK